MLSEKGVAVCRWEDPSDWRENMGPKVNDSAAVTFRDSLFALGIKATSLPCLLHWATVKDRKYKSVSLMSSALKGRCDEREPGCLPSAL